MSKIVIWFEKEASYSKINNPECNQLPKLLVYGQHIPMEYVTNGT